MNDQHPFQLSDFVFSAKIDYLSITTPGRQALPKTEGRVLWPKSKNSSELTIHDPTPADVKSLAIAVPSNSISEVEVSIDIRPKWSCETDERYRLLSNLKAMVAKGLNPKLPQQEGQIFRGAYNPEHARPAPFNRRIPLPTEQLLYGHRYDPAQVKVYIKRTDNGQALPPELQCVRIEIRLAGTALEAHSLTTASDLLGFSYRRELSRYFRHVNGSRRQPAKDAKPKDPKLLTALHRAMDRFDSEHWQLLGVGAFLPGGIRASGPKKFVRNMVFNNRIGQALHRLQTSFEATQFVCADAPLLVKTSAAARAYRSQAKSPMTYRR